MMRMVMETGLVVVMVVVVVGVTGVVMTAAVALEAWGFGASDSEHLPRRADARLCSKRFTFIDSFDPHRNCNHRTYNNSHFRDEKT